MRTTAPSRRKKKFLKVSITWISPEVGDALEGGGRGDGD